MSKHHLHHHHQMYNDSFNIQTAQAVSANLFYKGWIMMLQDESTLDNLKWLPKYLVINKFDKNALLYDSELESYKTTNDNDNTDLIRIDNGINKETFVNQWRTKSDKFDTFYSSYENTNAIQNFHNHFSNYNETNSESLNNNNNEVATPPSSNSAFRFAGLFFKRDKSDKVKHSTLKRAKSGIQLERKKPNLLSASSNTNDNSHLDHSPSSNNNNNNKSKLTTGTGRDYDQNRSSLQMRPSRSHESLSTSPLKHHKSATLLSSLTSHNNNNNNNNKQHTKLSKDLNRTPSSSLNRQSIINNNKKIENIIKLNLNSETISSTTNTEHIILINQIHTSFFNEENCFELKCFNNKISVFNNNNKSTKRLINTKDYDGADSGADSYEDEDYNSSNELDSINQGRKNSSTGAANTTTIITKYYDSSEFYSSHYFMCRSGEERDKWMHCFRNVTYPNLVNERHSVNSLQVWLLEAKGLAISTKPTKKYFCEVLINNSNTVYGRTCSKHKKDILFWGENFEFNAQNCNYLRVELYQESSETINSKKKSKKDKENHANILSGNKENKSSSFIYSHAANQTFLGYVNIPVNTIDNSQPVEKWYRLENPSIETTNQNNNHNSTSLIQPDPASNSSTSSTISNSTSHGSLTTTQNFSKDAITIRIKAKYQSVDILPLYCYSQLIEYIREKYLILMLELEPHLNVRVKDDLANSLVRIAHKLQIQTKFLTDLVIAEIIHLEDTSLTFRGNSLATKSMESYMKLIGDNYLKQTLSDCVRSIIDTAHDLEIDPSKCSNQSSLQANREELIQILHLVCGRVFNSCIHFPNEIKHVFACLRDECLRNGKTDEICDTLISASIFLRLICPAILSPNLFNLTQEYPQEKAARKLTLVAKTLQTIANFSKFGGKESYMSFDKMNDFVEEHTSLMREFLRNISTFSSSNDNLDDFQNNKNNNLPIIMLTPQTPQQQQQTSTNHKLYAMKRPTIEITEITPAANNNSKQFDLDFIDLGKQLSILYSLLTSIITSLDDVTKSKFDSKLINILNDINEMKLNNNYEIIPKETNNENKQQQQQQQKQQIASVTNQSDQYSLIDAKNIEQAKILENEINLLKIKLKETEISLKKEQNEKFLIESRLKQQQQNNDQQMREIINRLIKVEEELRKEQLEMHKVLKAKQELIEIQKKRIDYLSNRSQSSQNLNSKPVVQQQQQQQQQKMNSLNHSLIATYNNKLKQLNNKNFVKTDGITTALNSTLPAASTTTVINTNQPTTAISLPISISNLTLKQNDLAAQIAASPSSSSSSMTQFCNYLATNSLNNNNKTNNFLNKQNNLMINLDNFSSSTSSSTTSSSGLSNSSSLNHLNQTNPIISTTTTNNNNNNNILRHSEL